jgi:cytochrome c oxidase subunit II
VSLFRSNPRAGARPRAFRRWAPRAALAVALVTMTAGCQSSAWENLGLRKPVTTQASLVVQLWQGSWIAAIAVGVLVWGLILWTVIFHRKRAGSDKLPRQVRYNLPIEMLYTVLPFVMVGVLFFYTVRDENTIDKAAARDCAGDGVCELGQSWDGKLGAGDNENQMPLLEIPEHETVRFNLVSVDVIHSFWIVPFAFKRDVIPGHPNHFQVTATTTSTSIGRCSELCGLYHSRMLFRVKIVPKAQFNTWVHAQQAQQDAASATTAAQRNASGSTS